MQFDFTVENKILTPLDGEYTVIADNSDYFVHFSFDEEWTGKTKTVRFINGKNYVDVILPNDGRVQIPTQVMAPPLISVGVYSGHLRTSSPANIKCRVSILTPNGIPKEPTEDVYGQLISQYDTVKNTLSELEGDVDSLIFSEEERQTAEEKRQTAEAERQLMYSDFKEKGFEFSNSYIANVTGSENDTNLRAKHCIIGDEPIEFYITGSLTETIPSNGKSPENPSELTFPAAPRITFENMRISFSDVQYVLQTPWDTDVLDVKNGKFIHNIGIAEFHYFDGEIYLFDTVRGVYGKRYTIRRIESASGANVLTDNTEAYPHGKLGMRTFSPYFNTADSIDGCAHGYMYDGQEHCFGFGSKYETDEEAYVAFHLFVRGLYENGTPLTVYYEYDEPYITDLEKYDYRFTSSQTTVGARRSPFVMTYKADLRSLVDSLQAQINTLTSSLVAIAEGGEG